MTDAEQDLIKTAILRTLAYFDVFEYPLKSAEVWRWLYRGVGENWSVSLDEVKTQLVALVSEHKIEVDHDYYALPGRIKFVAQRAERKVRGEKKWNRAKSFARFLEVVPYIRMVAVVNTLAIDNARPESDIDMFIIVDPGRIWAARAMATVLANMLGIRRRGDKITNHVCLSFYVTTKALDLAKVKCALQDHHLSFWATQVVPLMDDGVYEKFVQANHGLTERLPQAWDWPWRERLIKPNRLLLGIKHTYGRIFGVVAGDMIEAYARDNQIKNIEKSVSSKLKMGTTEVLINEDMLKFHEDDRRAKYNALFVERCQLLGINP